MNNYLPFLAVEAVSLSLEEKNVSLRIQNKPEMEITNLMIN